MAKKVTAKMISEACGVNPSTVSRALNNSSLISEETKEYILKTAYKLGYKKSEPYVIQKTIGVLHPYMDIYFLNEIENRLEKSLSYSGYHLIYTGYKISDDNSIETRSKLLEHMVSLGVQAIVIFADDPDLFDVSNLKIPFVFFDLECSNMYKNNYHISFDMITGGKLAAGLLIKSGCKKPIILNNRNSVSSKVGRFFSFIQTFNENGYPVSDDQIISTEGIKNSLEESRNIVHYLLAKGMDFDCIYAGSDWRAFGALLALNEMGISIPEQIKLVSSDGSKLAKNNLIPITSIECDSQIAAIQISELLIKIINNENVPENNIVIPVSLFQGKTV